MSSLRIALCLLAGLAALPAIAQNPPVASPAPASACAILPETGPVAAPGPDIVTPPIPLPDRTLRCDDDDDLDFGGRLPVCRRPGPVAAPGNPRAACIAALDLGPIAATRPRTRPTPGCPQRSTTSIVALRGRNIGWSDVAMDVGDAPVVVTTLTASGPEIAAAEDPVVRGCFPGDCRLVRLVIAAGPPASLRITARWGDRSVSRDIALRPWCPR